MATLPSSPPAADSFPYRAALEAAADAVFIGDEHMRILWANRAFSAITGYELKEVAGRSTRFLRDEAGDSSSFDETWRTVSSGRIWRGRVRNRRKDGSLVDVEVSVTPVLDETGSITHFIGVGQDVTERKQVEASLRLRLAALEAAANSIIITDRSGHIQWVNPAFERLTGYSSEEAIGGTPRLLKSGQQDSAFYKTLWDTILSGQVCRGELTNRRKDGTHYVQQATITPVRDEGGEISHFVGVAEDVTERRDLEARLRQAQKMEAVGQLAGGIAHDFNNLLTTVLASAELMASELPPESSLHTDLAAIIKAGRRGADLTRNLLAFSRRQKLRVETLEVTAVIAEFARMIRRMLREDIALRVEFKEPVWVRADPGAIEQVLMNLATNARYAMPAGGTLSLAVGRVTLRAGQAALNGNGKPGEFAEITVRDTGTGMSEETRQRLFEPFFTTKPVGEGTGLGMAMVYGLMKEHGGHIVVDSELGRGTTFRLFVPVAPPEEASLDGRNGTETAGGSETILVVEDEPSVRRVVERTLGSHGYAVRTVSNGLEALDLLVTRREKVHLVMTDAVMPGLGGVELLDRLAEAGVAVPVLLTSGHPERDMARGRELPEGVPFIGKPWTIHELLRKVRATLDVAGRG